MPCSVSLITVMLINMLINMTINMTFIRQIKVKQSNNQCSFKLLMNWMPIDGYITWLFCNLEASACRSLTGCYSIAAVCLGTLVDCSPISSVSRTVVGVHYPRILVLP